MVKLLKEMLYIEAKDKEFLLANITRITQNNGNYKNAIYSLQSNFGNDSSQFFRQNGFSKISLKNRNS